jgi:hypothetical protein
MTKSNLDPHESKFSNSHQDFSGAVNESISLSENLCVNANLVTSLESLINSEQYSDVCFMVGVNRGLIEAFAPSLSPESGGTYVNAPFRSIHRRVFCQGWTAPSNEPLPTPSYLAAHTHTHTHLSNRKAQG